MKGVILTAGGATRLKPITEVYGKVLVPIYDKPMIYYGVSLLIKSGVTDIAFICSPNDLPLYKSLFDEKFNDLGLNFQFFVQKDPKGTADAVKSAISFIENENFILLYGDNIFVMDGMENLVKEGIRKNIGSCMFVLPVKDPERFGVVEFDGEKVIGMEEKPAHPKTNFIATGLYVFSKETSKKLQNIQLSERGEYEMTDVLLSFINEGKGKYIKLPEQCKWLDTGTFDSLLECAQIIKEFEDKHGPYGCLEFDLYKQGFITKEKLLKSIERYKKDYKERILNTLHSGQNTEVTVEVLNSLDEVIDILNKKGFKLIEEWVLNDHYFSKFSKNQLKNMNYTEIIDNSILLRLREGKNIEQKIIYKKKEYDKQDNVINEEKTIVTVDNSENVKKIFSLSGIEEWCQIIDKNYLYKNETCEIDLQVVDGLGVFLELEEDDSMSGLSKLEKAEKMKAFLQTLGLNLGKDFSCKKVYMKFKKENS